MPPFSTLFVLVLVILTAATSTQAALTFPSWYAASSPLDRAASYVANSLANMFSPSSDSKPLQFKLVMSIHHSTHPDHLGKSAVYHYDSAGPLHAYNAIQQRRHTYTGVHTQTRSLKRLVDPHQYFQHRNDIIHRSRAATASLDCSDQTSQDAFSASRQLNDLHGTLNWEDEDALTPDVTKRSTLLALARMSSAAYETPPNPPSWQPTPGFEDWNTSDSFGWIEDGIRGHVFSSGPDDDIIVVALKGTSAALFPGGDDTARRDKLNDNLLFSCCCAKVSWAWSPVCSCPFNGTTCSQPCLERSLLHQSVYYPLITDLYNNISYNYPNSQIWVTGHSLGGALASLIGYTFGVPGITYEAPAERMAAKRLHLPMPPGSQKKGDGSQKKGDGKAEEYEPPALPITHVFHSADPIPMGTCTGQTSLCGSAGYAMESVCHAGQVVLYNTTGLLGWSSNIGTHRIANLVDDLLAEHWGDRVRKEWKRVDGSNVHKSTSLAWWPWKGGKDQGDGENAKMPEWLVKLGEVPVVSNQNDCVDCGDWKFVDADKRK